MKDIESLLKMLLIKYNRRILSQSCWGLDGFDGVEVGVERISIGMRGEEEQSKDRIAVWEEIRVLLLHNRLGLLQHLYPAQHTDKLGPL